ncbi:MULTISPECIES: hypothetical protein [unclassified Acinetobacter]|uniref:hypothetical protein n=1 Tax=unclassified Acinetobacter TaxID=196816 RepID=UPI0029350C57|nr:MULTISPECIES: hypothetical protein [unclassified Acinetobacter]WOE32790.1 hypothetical protein QSG84_06340 [Acinetobacter sp. SAAs470]WOE38267.1 hypothetical protein QSG86_15395 [Acinetobacter sp. SAAs474]
MKSIFYVVPDHCDASRYSIKLKHDTDVEYISRNAFVFADDCAEDYYDNHDGWESTWPLEFHLYESEDADKPFHKCLISIQINPSFSCKDLPNE